MCFKLLKEIPCVWKVSHLKFKFYFVANRNWRIHFFLWLSPQKYKCMKLSLQTDIIRHGSSWVCGVWAGQWLQVGVISVCAGQGLRGEVESISCYRNAWLEFRWISLSHAAQCYCEMVNCYFQDLCEHLTVYFSLQLLCLTYCIIMLVGFLWLL